MKNRTYVWVKTDIVDVSVQPSSPRKERKLRSIPTANNTRRSKKRIIVTSNTNSNTEWGWTRAYLLESFSPNKKRPNTISTDNTAFSDINKDISVEIDDIGSEYNGNSVVILAKNTKDAIYTANSWEFDNSDQPPNDLCQLTHLHEPAVVCCLRRRYAEDKIYTATGPILLALNPFKKCTDLYSHRTLQQYRDRGEGQGECDQNYALPPHAYAVADDAYRSMLRFIENSNGASDNELKANQSILVSGESGAGKTQTTKFIMQYITTISQKHNAKNMEIDHTRVSSTTKKATVNSIEQQILLSNPVLESFGNARTIRNDNSSRFGKFIEIKFSTSGALLGASIETYLLERVRLITQTSGERNFHIFYELLAAASRKERNQLLLLDLKARDFKMTSMSDTYDRRDEVSDVDTFRDLKDAMATVGFVDKEQMDIFSIASALLHASNLSFRESTHVEKTELIDNSSLDAFANLLGVTIDSLNKSLCSSTIEARGERFIKNLSILQAIKAIEALIKATYKALFAYIVQRVNRSITSHNTGMKQEMKSASFIGVLDIFGFESFTTNSFEQLCINYCNEALQQQFNRFVFKLEQQEYEREGIEWSFICFPDNQDVLDLVDQKRTGILSILDEQCRLPKCNDRSFTSATYDKCISHPRFKSSERQKVCGAFSIEHYAGPVEYTTESFVEKNKDELPKESTDLLLSSKNHFVQLLGDILNTSPSSSSPSSVSSSVSTLKRSSSSLTRASVGSQFCSQLRQLRNRIDATTPHYIRCLKPNDSLIPNDFNNSIIADQLRCAGVLEAVRVSRIGYPQRFTHSLFTTRYSLLSIQEVRSSTRRGHPSWKKQNVVATVTALVKNITRLMLPPGSPLSSNTPKYNNRIDNNDLIDVGIQVGNTKIFLRQHAFDALERLRNDKMNKSAIKIQAIIRRSLSRNYYLRLQYSALVLQCCIRCLLARRLVWNRKMTKTAILLQSFWRMKLARINFNSIIFFAISLQRHYRGKVARKKFSFMKVEHKAILIQSTYRRFVCRRRFQIAQRLALNLQQLFRGHKARKFRKQLQMESRNLDLVIKERDKYRQEVLVLRKELEEARKLASKNSATCHRNIPSSPASKCRESQNLAEGYCRKDREPEIPRRELNCSHQQIEENKNIGSHDNTTPEPENPPFLKRIFRRNGNFSNDSIATDDDTSNKKNPSTLGALQVLFGLNSSGKADVSLLDSVVVPSNENDNYIPQKINFSPLVSPTQGFHVLPSSSFLVDKDLSSRTSTASHSSCHSTDVTHPLGVSVLSSVFSNADGNVMPIHDAVRAHDDISLIEAVDQSQNIDIAINTGDLEGKTPLHLASLFSDTKIVAYLLDNHAVANAQDHTGNTPLHCATCPSVIKLLLRDGAANPNIPNGSGLTALHLAAMRRDLDCVQYLLEYGADINVADDVKWFTPLHAIAQSTQEQGMHLSQSIHVEPLCLSDIESSSLSKTGQIAKLLCENKFSCAPDLNSQDSDGNCPLHYAAILSETLSMELMTIFLQNGSDPNITNHRGQSALLLFCHNQDFQNKYPALFQDVLDLLLFHYQSDPNIFSYSGCTPLHLALFHRDVDSATKLVKSGAQLNVPWNKPIKWDVFWMNDSKSTEVLPSDMIIDSDSLFRILSAITQPQQNAIVRSFCMQCKKNLRLRKGQHCRHCGRFVCHDCSGRRITLDFFPISFHHMESEGETLLICAVCEEILVSKHNTMSDETLEREPFTVINCRGRISG